MKSAQGRWGRITRVEHAMMSACMGEWWILWADCAVTQANGEPPPWGRSRGPAMELCRCSPASTGALTSSTKSSGGVTTCPCCSSHIARTPNLLGPRGRALGRVGLRGILLTIAPRWRWSNGEAAGRKAVAGETRHARSRPTGGTQPRGMILERCEFCALF